MELIEKFLNSKEDVLYYTAKETGISLEQIKLIESDLWKGVAFYINNPHLIKGDKIDLEHFIRFKPRSKKNIIKKAEKKLKYLNDLKNKEEKDFENIKRYKKIIEKFKLENG